MSLIWNQIVCKITKWAQYLSTVSLSVMIYNLNLVNLVARPAKSQYLFLDQNSYLLVSLISLNFHL